VEWEWQKKKVLSITSKPFISKIPLIFLENYFFIVYCLSTVKVPVKADGAVLVRIPPSNLLFDAFKVPCPFHLLVALSSKNKYITLELGVLLQLPLNVEKVPSFIVKVPSPKKEKTVGLYVIPFINEGPLKIVPARLTGCSGIGHSVFLQAVTHKIIVIVKRNNFFMFCILFL
jgi:hypothetical protein